MKIKEKKEQYFENHSFPGNVISGVIHAFYFVLIVGK